MTQNADIPVKVQALLLADRVYEDLLTHNKIIAGTFNQLFVRGVGPQIIAGTYWLYFGVTQLRGAIPFSIRIVDLADDSTLIQADGFEIRCDDPNRLADMIVQLPIPAPHPGVFCIEVLNGDVVVGTLRFEIKLHPEASK